MQTEIFDGTFAGLSVGLDKVVLEKEFPLTLLELLEETVYIAKTIAKIDKNPASPMTNERITDNTLAHKSAQGKQQINHHPG